METRNCLKCTGQLAQVEHCFYVCDHCARHYRLTKTDTLVERWGGAISLVLYPVIFDRKPQEKARQIGESLCHSALDGQKSVFRRLSCIQLKAIRYEIAEELDNPQQPVREILNCNASEADLREYLAEIAKILAEFLASPDCIN